MTLKAKHVILMCESFMFAETNYNISRLTLWCYKHIGLFFWPDKPDLMLQFYKITRWRFCSKLYNVNHMKTFDLE